MVPSSHLDKQPSDLRQTLSRVQAAKIRAHFVPMQPTEGAEWANGSRLRVTASTSGKIIIGGYRMGNSLYM
jgi:hypothetical protein